MNLITNAGNFVKIEHMIRSWGCIYSEIW